MKIRTVDHFSWSASSGRTKNKRKRESVNGHCGVPEAITHHHLDDLHAAMALFHRCVVAGLAPDCAALHMRGCVGNWGKYQRCGSWT